MTRSGKLETENEIERAHLCLQILPVPEPEPTQPEADESPRQPGSGVMPTGQTPDYNSREQAQQQMGMQSASSDFAASGRVVYGGQPAAGGFGDMQHDAQQSPGGGSDWSEGEPDLTFDNSGNAGRNVGAG